MSTAALTAYDVERIRQDFPILQRTVHGKPLVYLDNAATSQKPRQVIDAISNYYLSENSNIHRGVHELSQLATEDYEKARVKIQRFLNAALGPGSAPELHFEEEPIEELTCQLVHRFSPAVQAR